MSRLAHKSPLPAKRRPRNKVSARRSRLAKDVHVIAYHPKSGVDDYVRQVTSAAPMQLVQMERIGVVGSLIRDLSWNDDKEPVVCCAPTIAIAAGFSLVAWR